MCQVVFVKCEKYFYNHDFLAHSSLACIVSKRFRTVLNTGLKTINNKT